MTLIHKISILNTPRVYFQNYKYGRIFFTPEKQNMTTNGSSSFVLVLKEGAEVKEFAEVLDKLQVIICLNFYNSS